MRYFFNFYIFYFFLLPFIFLFDLENLNLEYFFILSIFLFFLFGLNLRLNERTRVETFNYSVLNIQHFFLFLFFSLYFVDFQTHFETLISIYNGEYFEAGIEKSIIRYTYETKPTVLSQFSTIFYFCFCFTLGVILSNVNKYKFLFIILWLILAIFETSTLSRASLVLGITGIATTFIYNFRYEFPKISILKIHLYLSLILLTLFGVFSISAFGRVSNSENAFNIVLEKLSSYTIAMYEALLLWLQEFNFSSFKFGVNTFTFIPKLVGIKFESGFYLPIDTKFGETNIYTFVRGIIEDFSFFSLFIFLIFGFQINLLDSKLNSSKFFLVFNLWIINLFLYPMISIFNFTTYFIGYFIFAVFVNKKNIQL